MTKTGERMLGRLKMKDSGIEWLGDIPAHWTLERLGDVTALKTSNVDKKAVGGQEAVKLCNYVDVYYNAKITSEIEFMDSSATASEISKFSLRKGDVVFTKDSESPHDIGIPALVDEDIEGLVCGYHLSIAHGVDNILLGSFLYYSLISLPCVYQFFNAANGVTRFGLTQSGVKNIRLPVPPISQQKPIADYLDKKTAQIDGLIGKKKELIERLREQRTALITHAVTKGIDDSIPVKESGVEWLGGIPEHWDVRRLKFIVSKVGSGVTPKGGANVYEDSGILFLRSQNIHFNGLRLDDVAYIATDVHMGMSNSRVLAGDVLLNITGASIGRCYYFAGELGEANVNQHVCIIRPEDNLLPRYLHYVLWSEIGQLQIQLEQSGSGREGLNFDVLKNFLIPVMGLDEQQQIINYLDKKKQQIDNLILTADGAITKLEEYRTSLITAAVTGKVRVLDSEEVHSSNELELLMVAEEKGGYECKIKS